jgi:hypothetical protein
MRRKFCHGGLQNWIELSWRQVIDGRRTVFAERRGLAATAA